MELLKLVFGDSDSEEEEEEEGVRSLDPSACTFPPKSPRSREGLELRPSGEWAPVGGVPGLWLCRGFLPPGGQAQLLGCISQEGWFPDPHHNQVHSSTLPSGRLKR